MVTWLVGSWLAGRPLCFASQPAFPSYAIASLMLRPVFVHRPHHPHHHHCYHCCSSSIDCPIALACIPPSIRQTVHSNLSSTAQGSRRQSLWQSWPRASATSPTYIPASLVKSYSTSPRRTITSTPPTTDPIPSRCPSPASCPITHRPIPGPYPTTVAQRSTQRIGQQDYSNPI